MGHDALTMTTTPPGATAPSSMLRSIRSTPTRSAYHCHATLIVRLTTTETVQISLATPLAVVAAADYVLRPLDGACARQLPVQDVAKAAATVSKAYRALAGGSGWAQHAASLVATVADYPVLCPQQLLSQVNATLVMLYDVTSCTFVMLSTRDALSQLGMHAAPVPAQHATVVEATVVDADDGHRVGQSDAQPFTPSAHERSVAIALFLPVYCSTSPQSLLEMIQNDVTTGFLAHPSVLRGLYSWAFGQGLQLAHFADTSPAQRTMFDVPPMRTLEDLQSAVKGLKRVLAKFGAVEMVELVSRVHDFLCSLMGDDPSAVAA
ncbi:hypothetical protein SDRG_11601, partial [Saprolegnia diclina VS20]